MTDKEKMYVDRLVSIKWGWNARYCMNYIDPLSYNRIQCILSEIRRDKEIDYDDWRIFARIYKSYYDQYYIVKELIKQEPRVHAQLFIGKKKIRKWLFNRDKKCLCCGSTNQLSVDHINPIHLGGENKLMNLQTLCKSCNSKKGPTYKDFRK